MKYLNKSDYKRWTTLNSFNKGWDQRTIKMAEFILPNTKVIEYGAGRKVIKKYLPKNCIYTPSDIVDRGDGTIICDLNQKTLPKFDNYNYAIFSGVLEYVNNVPRLIQHLTNNIDIFIISYEVLKDDITLKRGIQGWVNSYKERELLNIFENNGYKLTDKSSWLNQGIYVFKKSSQG